MMIFGLIFHFSQAFAAQSDLLKKIEACKATSSPIHVWLVKQWHLSPGVDTHMHRDLKPKAAPNQREIYDQLAAWVQQKKVDTVLAEGCEGEITEAFKPVFNGWSYADLVAQASLSGYDAIPTHAVVKLEAKMTDQVLSMCADDLSEVKKGQLALSDMRGDAGFLSRLQQYRDNPHLAEFYLDGVKDSFHLKKRPTVSDALRLVKIDLKKSFQKFQSSLQTRDRKVIRTILAQKTQKPIVVVFGGLHANDLKAQMEKQKLNCEIYEPLHYANDEEQLLDRLKSAIR